MERLNVSQRSSSGDQNCLKLDPSLSAPRREPESDGWMSRVVKPRTPPPAGQVHSEVQGVETHRLRLNLQPSCSDEMLAGANTP